MYACLRVPHINPSPQRAVQVLETTPFHQCVVFTNSRILGQRVAQLLEQLGFPAQFVCGDMPQEQRLSAVARLRAFELRVLVCTCTYLHTLSHPHTHTLMHTSPHTTRAHIHAYKHTHTHTHPHTRTHARAHAHTHTHTHWHTA